MHARTELFFFVDSIMGAIPVSKAGFLWGNPEEEEVHDCPFPMYLKVMRSVLGNWCGIFAQELHVLPPHTCGGKHGHLYA